MIVVTAICLAVGFGSYTVRQGRVYGDSPMSMLTAPFSQPRLAGIWSSPKRVAELDALTAALLGRVNRGDRLLVVGKASILYYLTGTRPALDHSWMAPEISVEVKVRSLERMISLGHQPRYVVRTRIPNLKALESERIKLRYPLHAYVVEHYSFEVAFGSAQIWRRKD
jgi:hypothetical protein